MNKNIQYKKLGEICDFISGGTPSKSKNEYWKNGNIPWIKISDFKEKYIKFSDEKITKIGLESSSAKILKKGTILYTIFASVGKVAILDIEATTNQAVVGINLKEDNSIDKDFLYYFLCSIENNIKKQARGVAQNNINISILKNINIPILPMSFQKNIVKTLNKLENILDNLKQKKLLINFLNKSLFTTMFGDIEKKSEYHKLSNICDVRDGTHDSPEYITTDKRFPLITSKNLKGDKIDFSEVNFISEADFNKINVRSKVDIGDILMPMIGTIGNPIIVKIDKKFSIKNLALIKFKNSQIINTFLKFLLLSDYFNLIISQKNKGGTQKFLSLSDIRNFLIPIPPIELQNKFAERIEKIEKLKFEIEKSIETAQNLYDSLISKYFDN
ncbi:restriction endonuclease subunit S [Fusobacterium periodonticum]|uniref:Type I restriction-modification enzyme, S subunit n=1 Tax=Fusobacterium periodonticum 1_1_41FAA TaxID=469621 RepID=D6LFN1_9FUSO|nr:restriction endonuclease subunit S [Fusobacterium periodonticum]EFG28966.1 type I restriction modification DNA specificity domain protein [Fusobacterium periodonticum 1_1_41FAA]